MPVDVADQRLGKLIFGGSIAGMLAHAIFLAVFFVIGGYKLVILNVGVRLLFGFCAYLAPHTWR